VVIGDGPVGAARQVNLDQLIAGLTDAVVVVDERGEIVFVNARAEELFDFPRDELVGRPVELLLPEQLHHAHLEHRAGYMREPRSRPMGSGLDVTARRRDGSEVPVEIGLSHVQTDDGMLVVAVIADITQRRRLEATLVQTEKLEAIGRLAGGIAHDFNNLLTAIMGYAGFLIRELDEGSRTRRDAIEIRTAAQRAAALTRQLIVFSHTEVVEPEVIDLNVHIGDLESLLAGLISEDTRIESRLQTDLWPVMIDPGQFERVVTNLVLNARDAMPTGGQLKIETKNVSLDDGWLEVPEGDFVLMTIEDSGTGMDEETFRHAFEPFFTTKEAEKGTGLGLPTVHGIVAHVGGALRLYSELGLGTTVKVYFPRAHEPLTTREERALEPIDSVRGSGGVLLVEDDETVRLLVLRMLESLGYGVFVAASPAEASGLFDLHPEEISVLVTDMILPEADGREVAERLTAAAPGLRVLYMSGYTKDALVRRRELAPHFAFIEKPFTLVELGRALQDLLAE
jgi:PAS domain S-box-containing protein